MMKLLIGLTVALMAAVVKAAPVETAAGGHVKKAMVTVPTPTGNAVLATPSILDECLEAYERGDFPHFEVAHVEPSQTHRPHLPDCDHWHEGGIFCPLSHDTDNCESVLKSYWAATSTVTNEAKIIHTRVAARDGPVLGELPNGQVIEPLFIRKPSVLGKPPIDPLVKPLKARDAQMLDELPDGLVYNPSGQIEQKLKSRDAQTIAEGPDGNVYNPQGQTAEKVKSLGGPVVGRLPNNQVIEPLKGRDAQILGEGLDGSVYNPEGQIAEPTITARMENARTPECNPSTTPLPAVCIPVEKRESKPKCPVLFCPWGPETTSVPVPG